MENRIIMYLAEQLKVPIYAEVPESAPTKFIVVDKLGSTLKEHLSSIRVAIQSYDESKAKTSKLNDEAIAKMLEITKEINISKVNLETDYPFNDISRKRYRYQAVFEIFYC